jgi:CubicO group peptidase (beta-lactamase class C family)
MLVFIACAIPLAAPASAPRADHEAVASGVEAGRHNEQDLDVYVRQLIASFEIPALSIAIVDRDRNLYSKGFGRLDIAEPTENNANALFHMASLTKPFVATAIMQLAEQGKLSLDDPVVKHLPYFKMASGPYQRITIRQMLSHVSGMPDEPDYQWESPAFDVGALERYVRSLADRNMIADPEQKRAYSNIAFEVLGDVIAKVSGRTFEDYVAVSILRPAGMTSSTLLNTEARAKPLATPHVVDDRLAVVASSVFPYNRMHAPSSTLYSSANDMARWLRLQLNEGSLDGKKILSPPGVQEMRRAHFAAARNKVGLGWMLGEDEGEPIVFHEGRDTGFASFMILYPKSGIGIALMGNTDDLPVNRLVAAARQLALGQPIAPFIEPVTQPMLKAYRTGGVEAALEIYNTLKRTSASTVSFSEGQLAGMGNHLAGLGRTDDAVRILEFNLGLFPESLQTMELMAEIHANTRQTAKARAILQRMLKLEPGNESAKAMYESL